MRTQPVQIILAITALTLTLGCNNAGETKATAAEPETVKAGTKIPTILMKTLESGVSKEDEPVPLMVVEDVNGESGKVVIPKGSIVKAAVSWSRREGSLDGVMGRPARLTIQAVEVKASDGSIVPVSSDESLKPDSTYELNRDNTGKVDPSPEVKTILEDPKNQEAVKLLEVLIAGEGAEAQTQTPEGREKVAQVYEQLGLPKTAELVKTGQIDQVRNLISDAQKGQALLAIATGSAPLAFASLVEATRFATSLPNRLSRMTRGRNIKAYIGTPITVYVSKNVQVAGTNG